MSAWMEARGLGARFVCPALPPRPREAIALIAPLAERLAREAGGTPCFVGSSLGGFYATHFAERLGARAVLLNPAVDPYAGLEAALGPQQNLYTGERYELTRDDLNAWRELSAPAIDPERYLLIVETGDEVLDYRLALVRYAGARTVVRQGGDHTLQSFAEHLPRILAFAGLSGPAPAA
jgi:predicted esterase YcpF (UPF0227 family)